MRNLIALPFLLAVFSFQAGPIDQWVWRNRLPCSPQFNSLTHGAGLWVASPDQVCLFLATSPDAVNWDAVSLGTNTIFSQCAYGNGVFVVGATRGAWVSTNAHNWFHAPGAQTFDRLVFGNGWFVGCDSSTFKIWRSADGTNWTSSSLFAPTRFRPATPSGPPGSPLARSPISPLPLTCQSPQRRTLTASSTAHAR